jgi:hypothetical protein
VDGVRCLYRFRLNQDMLATAVHGSGSSRFLSDEAALGIIIGVLALLVAVATFILTYVIGVLRRRFIYGMTVSAPLVNSSVARPELHMLWREQEVTNPHILEVELAYRGRADVESSDFDKDRPLCLDMGVPIIDLVETVFHLAKAPLPRVEAVGTELRIGPDLLRKGQAMTFVVLADGPSARLACVNPVVNVKDREVRYQARQEAGRGTLRRVLAWTIILIIIFYVATQPAGTADAIHHFYNEIHSAAVALAKFVNSL